MNRDHLLPLLLLATVSVGCSWLEFRDASTSPPSQEANIASNTDVPTNPVVARENPAADIDAMADKFLDQKAFQAKILATGDKDFTTEIAFVAPDRFWIKSGPGLERIIIGKDVYITLDGSWTKLPGGLGGTPEDLRKAFNKEGRKWFSDVKFAGEETVNGEASFAYEYKNKGEESLGENDSKIWVAKDDGLPLKLESRYKTGSLKTMVIEYGYDANRKIEAPVTKK